MKKMGLLEILASNMDMETRKALLRVPQIYVCNSVDDYINGKEEITRHYSTLIIPNIFLEPMHNECGEIVSYTHSDNQETISFSISDSTGSSEILWPLVNTMHLNEQYLESFINNPRQIDSAMLIYDSEHKNSFLTMVVENTYKKGIEKVMQEIWPN